MEIIDRKPLGVIDALTAGFELVLRNPWILLLPIAVDLLLWLGPHVPAESVFQKILSTFPPPDASLTPDMLQNWNTLKAALQTPIQRFNVLEFVSLGLPTLAGFFMLSVDSPVTRVPVFSISSASTLLGTALLLSIAGLLLMCIYLESFVSAVRNENGTLKIFVRRLVKAFWRLAVLIVSVFFAALVFLFFLLIVLTIIFMISPRLAAILGYLGAMLLFSGLVYLAFAVPAIFLSDSNTLQAIANSVTIFRYHSWAATGLIVLSLVIESGFLYVWQQLFGSLWGAVLSMVGNAFLSSGLIASVMLFYYDRYTWLSMVRERIRQSHPSIKG